LKSFQLNGEDTIPDNLDLNWDEHIFKYQFNFSELGLQDEISLNYILNGPEGAFKGVANATDGIEFKGLTDGDYQFSVSATNKKNIHSKNKLNFKFSIANPLRDSIWRYIIYGFILSLWTLGIVLLTRNKLKKDIQILEEALLVKTNKLNQIEKGKYGLVEEDTIK
jgi:hypothetical protein